MQLLWKIHLEPKITRSNKKINGIVVQEQQEKNGVWTYLLQHAASDYVDKNESLA